MPPPIPPVATAVVVSATAVLALGLGVWIGPGDGALPVVVVLAAGLLAALSVTHRRLATARAEAEIDALTGVGNRRSLDGALHRLPVGGVVVILDLDHFKRFNDRRGHLAGDDVLRAFARVLTTAVRESDSVCRFGGEEFVLVVLDPADAGDLFLRVRSAWEAGSPAVTFSAGLAARRPGEDPSAVLQRADASLYEAKSGGRDRQAGTAADHQVA